MSGTPEEPATAEHRYEDWTIGPGTRWGFVGIVPPNQTPILYNEETGDLHEGRIDRDSRELVAEDAPAWEPEPGETLGELLERVGDEIGWDSLSTFAREHLEDEAANQESGS